jgi:hypothetical protein
MQAITTESVTTDQRRVASNVATLDDNWKSIFRLGGAAALTTVFVGLAEIFITMLPGGERVPSGSADIVRWFTMFQNNWFLGLRNLGLLNIVFNILAIPFFLALYGAHRRVNESYAALAVIVSFIANAVFFATNRAFPMLALSNQYAAATTEAQRSVLAAGAAMLAVGESHTPGTFFVFFLAEVAGILIGLVVLQGNIFGKFAAWAGILGSTFLLAFEVCSDFIPALFDAALVIALCGGLLTMVWDILAARTLFRLGRPAAATIH